jgi:hypothetical protein
MDPKSVMSEKFNEDCDEVDDTMNDRYEQQERDDVPFERVEDGQ